ncbi:glycosyltransferase [Serratia rubidaea]|uniref:glycosyltransferase n=1 Tax=Serratia rubidaea TaxID=61652 RepID=UPI001BB010FB|nr:glycosyltransferase [Serratia rubidaea]MBS0972401.1 glycosyltransferase [Serratia rubidaea]MDC6111574.1 glycosyltransferase [Serratia rubidaea]
MTAESGVIDQDALPKVSIYISTCNRVDRLKRAVQSVLNQDYPNIEVLVCDDASVDGTADYMAELCAKDERVHYLRNEKNMGACATRNLGIFTASGKFIAGLDDDDEFTPDRISFLVKNWDDQYSFLCCNFKEVYSDGSHNIYYKQDEPLVADYRALMFDNIASNQVFTLTKNLQDIGGFDTRVRRLQDWDTWLRLAHAHGPFKRFPEYKYLMHHDHAKNEQRVSKSYPLSSALADLLERNSNIYVGADAKYMQFIVASTDKSASFSESIYWAVKKTAPKYIVKYILNRLNLNLGLIKS